MPSAAAMLNRRSFKVPDPYANRRPSGDHTGSASEPVSVVTRTRLPSLRSSIQMSGLPCRIDRSAGPSASRPATGAASFVVGVRTVGRPSRRARRCPAARRTAWASPPWRADRPMHSASPGGTACSHPRPTGNIAQISTTKPERRGCEHTVSPGDAECIGQSARHGGDPHAVRRAARRSRARIYGHATVKRRPQNWPRLLAGRDADGPAESSIRHGAIPTSESRTSRTAASSASPRTPVPTHLRVWSPDGQRWGTGIRHLPKERRLSIAAADGRGVAQELPCPGAYCEPTDW